MSPRNFLILLAATVIAVACATVAVVTRPGDAAFARAGTPLFPGLLDAVNSVEKVQMNSAEGGTLTFQRKGTAWSIVERDGYPAKSDLINSMVVRIAQMNFVAPKTAKPELYSRLELGDPDKKDSKSLRVRLYGAGGAPLADLIVGRARAVMDGSSQGGTYVRFPGNAQTWIASGDLEIGRPISEWVDRSLFDVSEKRVKSIRITHPNGEVVHVFKDQAADPHYILDKVPAGKEVANEFSVDAVATTLGEFLMDDVAKRGAHKIDPAKATRVVYQTFDGLTVTALMQKFPGKDGAKDEFWAELTVEGGKDVAEEVKRLKARTDPWVYRINDFRFDSIAKHMADLVKDAEPKKRS